MVVQYCYACQWEQIEKLVETLKVCFPNSVIGSYRCKKPGKKLDVYCGKDKQTAKQKIFSVRDEAEDKQRHIIEAIKNHLNLEQS